MAMTDFMFTRNVSGHPKLKKLCADIEDDIYRGGKDDKQAVADASKDIRLAAEYIKEQLTFCVGKQVYDDSVLGEQDKWSRLCYVLEDMESLSEDRKTINKAIAIAEDINEKLLGTFLKSIPEELACPAAAEEEPDETNYTDRSVWEIARDFDTPLQRKAPWIVHEPNYYNDASMVRYQNDFLDWFDRQDDEAQKKIVQAVRVFKLQKRAGACLKTILALPFSVLIMAELSLYAWLSNLASGWIAGFTAAVAPIFYWVFTGIVYAFLGFSMYGINKYIYKKLENKFGKS